MVTLIMFFVRGYHAHGIGMVLCDEVCFKKERRGRAGRVKTERGHREREDRNKREERW
jgi:hypothetical protein